MFTSGAFVTLITLKTQPLRTAILCTALIITCVILPLNLFTYLRVRRGQYSNFDVSVKQQRSSFYLLLLLLFSVLTALLFFAGISPSVSKGCFITCLLFLSAYMINRYSKVSLHAALSIYFCCCLSRFYPGQAMMLYCFCLFISASRLVLKRHTLFEVLSGNLLGLCFGMLLLHIN